MLTSAVRQGAKIAALPELWTTGYALNRLAELTEVETANSSLEFLQQVAQQQKLWIFAGSMLEKSEGAFYNTSYIIRDDGVIAGKFRKVHLFSLMEEEKYFSAGDGICIVDTPFGKAATMICYDLRFPELARKLAALGVVLTVVPAEWPHPRQEHWKILNQARAIENQNFILAVNRVGVSENTHFCGNSMIIDPWGRILAQGGEEEAVIVAELDMSQVEQVRNTIPCWRDRRPDVYNA
jgi:predicted amidohydrolase